jgi:hypothetical protein
LVLNVVLIDDHWGQSWRGNGAGSRAEALTGSMMSLLSRSSRIRLRRSSGPTNLCSAVDIASRQVIGEMAPQHRAEEFRRFLNRIDKSVPAHLACMSCSTTPRPTRHH